MEETNQDVIAGLLGIMDIIRESDYNEDQIRDALKNVVNLLPNSTFTASQKMIISVLDEFADNREKLYFQISMVLLDLG